MKINNNNNYNNFLRSLKQTQNKMSAQKDEHKTMGSTRKSVEIKFSEEAKKLSELSNQNSHTPRVEEIKKLIQNKTYEVDPKVITDGMIATINNQRGIES